MFELGIDIRPPVLRESAWLRAAVSLVQLELHHLPAACQAKNPQGLKICWQWWIQCQRLAHVLMEI